MAGMGVCVWVRVWVCGCVVKGRDMLYPKTGKGECCLGAGIGGEGGRGTRGHHSTQLWCVSRPDYGGWRYKMYQHMYAYTQVAFKSASIM